MVDMLISDNVRDCIHERTDVTRLYVLIHGTWSTPKIWSSKTSPFREVLGWHRQGVRFFRFRWSGWNRNSARLLGAERLQRAILQLSKRYPNAQIFLIGHSHGGTIAQYALRDSQVQSAVAGICCLGTPFLEFRNRDLAKPILYLIIALSVVLAIMPYLIAKYHYDHVGGVWWPVELSGVVGMVILMVLTAVREQARSRVAKWIDALPGHTADALTPPTVKLRALAMYVRNDEARWSIAVMGPIGRTFGILFSVATQATVIAILFIFFPAFLEGLINESWLNDQSKLLDQLLWSEQDLIYASLPTMAGGYAWLQLIFILFGATVVAAFAHGVLSPFFATHTIAFGQHSIRDALLLKGSVSARPNTFDPCYLSAINCGRKWLKPFSIAHSFFYKTPAIARIVRKWSDGCNFASLDLPAQRSRYRLVGVRALTLCLISIGVLVSHSLLTMLQVRKHYFAESFSYLGGIPIWNSDAAALKLAAREVRVLRLELPALPSSRKCFATIKERMVGAGSVPLRVKLDAGMVPHFYSTSSVVFRGETIYIDLVVSAMGAYQITVENLMDRSINGNVAINIACRHRMNINGVQ
jgi:pimeloyl-ACP methyl ester carboxylesterase